MIKKNVQSLHTKTYTTLGTLSEKTENIWWVFHGYGQLAEYFIKKFESVDLEKNFIIAPEAPSKLYINMDMTRAGASWLTKHETEIEKQNNLAYLDSIFEAELSNANLSKVHINGLGFSQGVSMLSRFFAHKKIPFHKFIIWAGTFPFELAASDLNITQKASFQFIVGNKDPFFQDKEKIQKEKERLLSLFPTIHFIEFKGGHTVDLKNLPTAIF